MQSKNKSSYQLPNNKTLNATKNEALKATKEEALKATKDEALKATKNKKSHDMDQNFGFLKQVFYFDLVLILQVLDLNYFEFLLHDTYQNTHLDLNFLQ